MEKFEHGFKIDKQYSNLDIYTAFKCGIMGGMRKSNTYNALILFADHTKKMYRDGRLDNNIYKYIGEGSTDNQNDEKGQNKTLKYSNTSDITVYLFERLVVGKGHVFLGEVRLVAPIAWEKEDGRDVISFPLIELGESMDVTDLLREFSIEELQIRGVLQDSFYLNELSISSLLKLMREKNIDSVTADSGWFLSKHGYYYNPLSERQTIENYKSKRINNSSAFENQNNYINPYFTPKMKSTTVIKSSIDVRRPKTHDEPNANSGFKLISLDIGGGFLGEVRVPFYESNKASEQMGISLLIGANGCGKSTLLSYLQKVFVDISQLGKKEVFLLDQSESFRVNYLIDGNEYMVSRSSGPEIRFEIQCNGTQIEPNELMYPQNIIASSFMLNDKFDYFSNDSIFRDGYKYLGIRDSEYTATLVNMTAKTAMTIIDRLTDFNFVKCVKRVLDYVGFKKSLKLELEVNLPNFEMDNPNDIKRLLEHEDLRKLELSKDEQEYLEVFFKKEHLESSLGMKKGIVWTIDLENDRTVRNYEEFELLMRLINNEILTIKNLMFQKPYRLIGRNNDFVTMEQLSSGEAHIVFTLINIAASIGDGALVLIDEPELSLHPNWQAKYVNILREVFDEYSTAQFVIATHSHFIVSDLVPENTSIVKLSHENGGIDVNVMVDKTYGWSAEDILLNVFGMASSRNYYFAVELDKLIKRVLQGDVNSDDPDYINMKKASINLKTDDPLAEFVLAIKETVENEKTV